MDSLLSRKADTLALIGGLVLVLIIAAAFILGISSTASDLEKSLNPDQAGAVPPVYDLDAASKLNLKGLSPGR